MSEDYPLSTLRHSAAHILASAVKDLFPEVKLGIGPAIDDGFYYDFLTPKPFTQDDLPKIEERMREIVAQDYPFIRTEMTKEEALRLFQEADEPLKVELIQETSPDEVHSTYTHNGFVDWCTGPHVPSTGHVKVFKLTHVAGAYWRGDERRPMLSRIYGTAYFTQEELDQHIQRLEEAEKRDHRKLGKDLDLFSFHEEAGPGLVFWHPKGALIRKIIEDYWRDQHLKGGYELVYTPHIAREGLWATSGHLDFFSESMYGPMEVEGMPYRIKPMNCPFHLLIYKTKVRSYRELPIRWAELGTVYRYERSGTLHGLVRVRGFTQDDAHIICRRDQMQDEIIRVLDFVIAMLSRFGFSEYDIYLATMPEKYVGTPEIWNEATEALRTALENKGLEYSVDEGGGAFYGPKIDIKIKDALGRVWQCSTIQLDFNEPERFDISYVGQDGQLHRPIMIHRALLGSLERFFGVLIEHYAGAFPLWLAPVQVRLLPIADRHYEFAESVCQKLKEHGFRAEVDVRNEKTGFKIRDAQLQKIPYMLIIGDREVSSNTVSVRSRNRGDIGSMEVEAFIQELVQELTM